MLLPVLLLMTLLLSQLLLQLLLLLLLLILLLSYSKVLDHLPMGELNDFTIRLQLPLIRIQVDEQMLAAESYRPRR